jgi:hypothetical protein
MVNMMEWQKQQVQNGNVDAMYVKVMTDEQLETLRKQIAVYATICEQLVQMHKTLSAQQDLAGTITHLYYCFSKFTISIYFYAQFILRISLLNPSILILAIKFEKKFFNFSFCAFLYILGCK